MFKIGDIDRTPYDKQINIYSEKAFNPKACVSMPDDFLEYNELMAEHYIQFSFNYDSKIDFIRTDYVDYKGLRYMIRRDYQPEEANLTHYKYTLKFEAPAMIWLDIVCFYRYQGVQETEWTLTEKADKFFQIGIDNINLYTGERWTIGKIEPTEMITLTFNSQNVFDMFTDVAEETGCEWYPDYKTKTLNLVAHHDQGSTVTLQREVSLNEITPSNEADEDYCTRLYAFGSNRNVPSNYRQPNIKRFVSDLAKLGVTVDKAQLQQLYNNLDPAIRDYAKVILFPIAVASGVVYAMDNSTGKPVEFTFSRASSATLFDSNKNLQLVNNDMPRIDYGNYTDGMKLLIERERTNYLTNSDFRIPNREYITWAISTYVDYIYENDHVTYTINNATSASRIQRIYRLYDSGNHNISIYADAGGRSITFASFVNAVVNNQISPNESGYKIHSCNFSVTSGSSDTTIRPYLKNTLGWSNGAQLLVKYIQIENGIDQTSYIHTTDTAATRAADLLTYNLPSASQVYIKTTKQETTLNKPSGVWNIHNDLNNEGIEVIAIMGNTPVNNNTSSDDIMDTIDAIVQKRLRMPVSNGDFIDAKPGLEGKQIIQNVKIFDHIYPKRIGTITALREETTKNDEGKEMTVFYFKDSGLQFKSEYILPGQTLMLQFGENSYLSGRECELSYNDKTNEFEIINNQDNPDFIIPNDIMRPRIGDFYTLYNFDISLVGDQYIPEAEQELLKEAKEWMDSIQEDNTSYTCMVNPVYRLQNNLDLPLGQSVKLKSIIFDGGEKISRIHSYSKYPATAKDQYIVGSKMVYKRMRRIENTVEENKKQTDLQYIEAMKIANNAVKTVKGLNYLRTALQNETTIDGGLILTTLIQFGLMQGNIWVNTAGVNGMYENENDIAFWGGGTLDQAINLVSNPEATEDVANFVVTHGGKVIMNQAIIRGKFESSKNGRRIVIDPDGSLKMIDGDNKELVSIYFADEIGGMIRINSNQYMTTLYDWGLHVESKDPNDSRSISLNKSYMSLNGSLNNGPYAEFSARIDDNGLLDMVMQGLPTSPENISDNRIWRNNNLIQIK